jgi:thiol-disulfide isomerase/thioredoxin
MVRDTNIVVLIYLKSKFMFSEITEDNLKEIIDSNEKVVVQFSAGWCGNCRIMKPKFKRFAGEYENATFVLVDAEKNPESRKLAKVDNLPTFAAFKNGELVNQIQTNKPDVLKELINEVASN